MTQAGPPSSVAALIGTAEQIIEAELVDRNICNDGGGNAEACASHLRAVIQGL